MTATKKNYIFNLILTGFNILFPVVSFPYAAKILGPVGIGKVQFILSFTQYFALIAALGIPIYGVRLISRSTHDTKLLHKNLGELLFIHIVCSIIITVIYVSVIFSFSFFGHDRSLYILSSSILLMGFTSVDWYFTGIENFRLIAIRSVSIKAISLICLFLFVKQRPDYGIYLIINLFALLGNNVINIISVSKHIKLTYRGVKKHLKPLMYTFGTTMATSMYTMLDTILIGFFSDERSVGLYAASVKLTKVSIPFIISSSTVLIPKISKLFQVDDLVSLKALLERSFDFIVLLAVPISAALLFLAPGLIYIFSGYQFTEAVTTMQILSPLTLIIGLGYFWGFQILIPAGKEREVLISVTIGMIINLALNCMLIPVYKQNGAAVANVISEFIVTLSYMFFSYKTTAIKISHKPLLFNLIAIIPFIMIVSLIGRLGLNVYYMLAVGSLTLAVTYLFIQVRLLKNSTVNEVLANYLLKRK